jgi:hypothetical protein
MLLCCAPEDSDAHKHETRLALLVMVLVLGAFITSTTDSPDYQKMSSLGIPTSLRAERGLRRAWQ